MPSTPTTKSQVQAYKFVLRRMQSALVRRDAVMLHDPMRTHTRATVVGACLAAVGLVGFLVWGLLSPSPTLPNKDGIIISKESGTVYVLLNAPTKQLIPTFNLASARLLLLAQQQQAGGGGAAAPAANQNQAATEVAQPTVVSDNDLKDVPKGRLRGIQDGPQLLPGPDQRIDDVWAVCDAYKLNHSLNDPTTGDQVETTVLGGVSKLGTPLPDHQGLLVQTDNGKDYLVYHLDGNANLPNTDTVRAEVVLTDKAVLGAFALDGIKPRKITTALFNAIPELPRLEAPDLPGAGQAPTTGVGDFTVGSVFRVVNAAEDGGATDYYVQEQDGIEQIKPTTANLIRYKLGADQDDIPAVQPAETTNVKHVEHINDDRIPATKPAILRAEPFPVACLGWSIPPGQDAGFTKVYVNNETAGVPIPRDKGWPGVKIGTPGPDKLRINYFYMPPGRAAVVRGAAGVNDFQMAPIYLVSDRGVKFGVPDRATASALGLDPTVPAPGNIMNLLPNGASLNTRAVLQSYDSLPPNGTPSYEPPPAANPTPQTGEQQEGEGGEDGTGQPGG